MFEECAEALGASPLSYYESDEIKAILRSMYSLSFYDFIDWNEIDNKVDIGNDLSQIKPTLEKLLGGPFDTFVYLEWRERGWPLKTDLDIILKHYDKVHWVDGHQFIFNPALGSIVEIQESGKIMVGVVPLPQPMLISLKQRIMELGGIKVSKKQARILEEQVISKIPFIKNAVDWRRIWHYPAWDSTDHNKLIRDILTRTRHKAIHESIYIEWINDGPGEIIQARVAPFVSYFRPLLQVPTNKLLLNPSSGGIIEMNFSGAVRFGSIALPTELLDAFKKRAVNLGTAQLLPEEIELINEYFIPKIPRISGTIDWDRMKEARGITVDNLLWVYAYGRLPSAKSPTLDQSLYFYDADNNLIQTTLEAVSEFFQESLGIPFNTYLFNPIDKYLIEFRSDGTVCVGLFDVSNV